MAAKPRHLDRLLAFLYPLLGRATVDGLYACDPAMNGGKVEFIPKISVSDPLARNLTTLPLDPIVLDLMAKAKLVKEVQIINGLLPGNLTRALAGEPVGVLYIQIRFRAAEDGPQKHA